MHHKLTQRILAAIIAMAPVQPSSTIFAKLLFVMAAILPPIAFGFPYGAPNCNDGNAALGQGSYHDAPRGLLSNLGIAVCMDGTNINTNDTIHVEPNNTYTWTLQRSINGGIEGIFVRLAPMMDTTSSSEIVAVIDTDTVLTTMNPLLQVSNFCASSATGITHTNKDRKPVIEITMDTTGLPIDSIYVLGITSVDSHDYAYTPYMIHVMDGTRNNHTTNTNGTCQPVEGTSAVNSFLSSSCYYSTAMMLTVVGLISTQVLA